MFRCFSIERKYGWINGVDGDSEVKFGINEVPPFFVYLEINKSDKRFPLCRTVVLVR